MTLNETLSTALAAVALAVSLLSLRYARTDRAADDAAKERETERALRTQLTAVLADLNRLQLENARLWAVAGAQPRAAVAGQSAILNQQNALLTRQAVDLVSRVPHLVGGVEYAMLATALAHLGDLAPADRYWREAVRRTAEPYFAAVARRGYANFLFATGEVERGRREFQASLEAVSGPGDYPSYTAGVTRMMWAVAEANARAGDRAGAQLAEAARLFGAIEGVGLRARAEAELAGVEAEVRAAAPPRPGLVTPFAPPAASRSTAG